MRYVDDDGMPVTVYEPNERQAGLRGGLEKAARDLYISRHVIARLFWRDFIAQFRQKIFGYLWAVVGPLIGVVSFLYLYFIEVLKPGDTEMPYTLYVFLGTAIWTCFPSAMASVSGGLQTHAELIMRTRVPKLALAVSSLAILAYSIIISIFTIALVFILNGKWPTFWLVAYPLLVMPLLLLGTALGLVLSVLGTIARDLTPLATQALQLGMYITPVIYVSGSIRNSHIRTVIDWNPITYLVDVPRSLIVFGQSENVDIFLWVGFGVVCLMILALRAFYLLEDLVAERL